MLIKNQNIIFFFLPVLLGIIQANLNIKIKFKKYLIYTLILINIFVTSKYHQRFNVEKKIHGIRKN